MLGRKNKLWINFQVVAEINIFFLRILIRITITTNLHELVNYRYLKTKKQKANTAEIITNIHLAKIIMTKD